MHFALTFIAKNCISGVICDISLFCFCRSMLLCTERYNNGYQSFRSETLNDENQICQKASRGHTIIRLSSVSTCEGESRAIIYLIGNCLLSSHIDIDGWEAKLN